MGSHLVQLVLRRPIQSMQLHSAIQPPLLRPLLRSRRRSRRRMSPPRLMDVPRLMLTAQTVHTHSHSPAWRKDRTRRTIPMPGRMIRAQKRTLTAFRYSPHLTSPHSPCLTSPHLTSRSPQLTSPNHLTSPHPPPHLTSPCLASPHQGKYLRHMYGRLKYELSLKLPALKKKWLPESYAHHRATGGGSPETPMRPVPQAPV